MGSPPSSLAVAAPKLYGLWWRGPLHTWAPNPPLVPLTGSPSSLLQMPSWGMATIYEMTHQRVWHPLMALTEPGGNHVSLSSDTT